METIKVKKVEDIFLVREETDKIEITNDAIIRYIHSSKRCPDPRINLDELRGIYVRSIKKSYAEESFMGSIFLNSKDIKKVCKG